MEESREREREKGKAKEKERGEGGGGELFEVLLFGKADRVLTEE